MAASSLASSGDFSRSWFFWIGAGDATFACDFRCFSSRPPVEVIERHAFAWLATRLSVLWNAAQPPDDDSPFMAKSALSFVCQNCGAAY
ncbi:MAG TPA: hypothetical protein VFR76_00755, partial [Verrucomicrobiae bacterium]|nr:hypothetical protein [Verrucomicrobiae bacterium]